jgi:hypothetical protein
MKIEIKMKTGLSCSACGSEWPWEEIAVTVPRHTAPVLLISGGNLHLAGNAAASR